MSKSDTFIESRQHRIVKEILQLREKKREREKRGLFFVEGEREVARAVACGFKPVYAVIGEGQGKNFEYIPTFVLSKKILSAVFVREEKAEALVVFEQKKAQDAGCFLQKGASEKGVWLALFDCEKPQNLGAIARSAVSFGVEGLILVGESVDPYSPHTIRASVGAIFSLLPCVYSREDFWQAVEKSGRRTIAAALSENSTELSRLKIACGDIIVLGNEGHGLAPEELRRMDVVSHIAMKQNQKVADSLNLSNAAAIYLYECARQLGQ